MKSQSFLINNLLNNLKYKFYHLPDDHNTINLAARNAAMANVYKWWRQHTTHIAFHLQVDVMSYHLSLGWTTPLISCLFYFIFQWMLKKVLCYIGYIYFRLTLSLWFVFYFFTFIFLLLSPGNMLILFFYFFLFFWCNGFYLLQSCSLIIFFLLLFSLQLFKFSFLIFKKPCL